MSEKPLIIIDGTYLCHYHSHRETPLTYRGMPVGIMFGFMKTLLMLAKKFESNRFAFTWDSNRSLRKVWFKKYKAKRELKRAEQSAEESLFLFRQMVELREKVIPEFGFRNNFLKPGFEADDLMASICYSNIEREIILVTSDNDLYQCLSPNRSMYNLVTKKLYTVKSLADEWRVTPKEWLMVKMLAGCSGDEVPGIEGIGYKTAIKYIKGELSEDSKAYKDILKGIDDGTVEMTRDLVELPFDGMFEPPHLEMKETFFVKDFLVLCDWYGFRSFEKDEESWRRNFNMKVGGR